MKVLLVHHTSIPEEHQCYQRLIHKAGDSLRVQRFCVDFKPHDPLLKWERLDHLWKSRDKTLMSLYERLQLATSDSDVLLLYHSGNIHPDFLPYLPTFNVFVGREEFTYSNFLCTQMVARFDAAFYSNIASRFQYERRGCKKLAWLPSFVFQEDIFAEYKIETILTTRRETDIIFSGEKTPYRQKRLDMLASAFPQAQFHYTDKKNSQFGCTPLYQLYKAAKIAWNIHDLTGPTTDQLFTAAAYGVLQICDNKTGLGQIFDLNREVIGFDTVPEAIESTYYYLKHDDERNEIIANAYQRFWKDYHAGAIWQRIYQQLQSWGVKEDRVTESPLKPVPQRTVIDSFNSGVEAVRRVARPAINLAHTVSKRSQAVSQKSIDERVYLGDKVVAYYENPEMRGLNMAQERLATGKPLDWSNILALNWAVTSLIGKAKNIVEIGSGTGPFAEFASVDTAREIDCFEEDDFARSQAIERRSRPNVRYYKTYEKHLRRNYDLLVSVEVVEHVANLGEFFAFCSKLAHRAIYTTPNRIVMRGADDIGPSNYPPHVREFAPGEIYWILKLFYKDVFLYYMPDIYVPWLEPMTISTHGTPIIAECIDPIQHQSINGQPNSHSNQAENSK